MINFAPTKPVDLSPEEYDRQARILYPFQIKQMGVLIRSGVASELSKSCLMFGIQPSEQVGEGSRLKVFRNRLRHLGQPEQEKIQRCLGNISMPPSAQIVFVEREDIKKATAAFRMSQDYTYAVAMNLGKDDDEDCTGIGDVSETTANAVTECCKALAAVRNTHQLTMLDPITLEECWNVPDAPIGWRPIDWV